MYFTIVVIWALVVTSQALVPQIIDVMLDPQTWEASQQVWCPQSFTLVEFMATYYLPSIWSRVFKLKQVLQTRRQMYLWCSLQKPTCFWGDNHDLCYSLLLCNHDYNIKIWTHSHVQINGHTLWKWSKSHYYKTRFFYY
jgi:hypothetical protein